MIYAEINKEVQIVEGGDVEMFYSQAEIVSMIVSGDMRPFYNSREWRKLSKSVMKDGNYECQYCKKKGKVSAAILTHHFNELKLRPDLAYSRTFVDEKGNTHPQLIPLCYDCHEEVHKRGVHAEEKQNKGFWQEEKW